MSISKSIPIKNEKEFRKVPEWMCNDFPVLKRVRVAYNGTLKWFDGDKDLGYIWIMPMLRERFGVGEEDTAYFDRCTDKDRKERKDHAWWVGIGNGKVMLRPNNRKSWESPIPVHRIVAAAWLQKKEKDTCVCFRDKNDVLNVCADNLIWCTKSESRRRDFETDITQSKQIPDKEIPTTQVPSKQVSTTQVPSKQEYTGKPVLQYRNDESKAFISEYPSVMAAYKATGVNDGSIRRCCRRKIKSAGGYVWCFKPDFTDFSVVENMTENG